MIYFIFSALIVLIDRGIKYWISTTLYLGQVMEAIPGVLRITHVENTGAAFSIFSDMRWPLVAVSSVAVIVLIFVVLLYRDGELGRLSASFMLGGAVGNLIDRVLTGKVVDMFEPVFINFAVFNVADIFVTVGCLMFIGHLIHQFVMERKGKSESVEQESEPSRHVTAPLPPLDEGAPPDGEKISEQQILLEYYLEQEIDGDER